MELAGPISIVRPRPVRRKTVSEELNTHSLKGSRDVRKSITLQRKIEFFGQLKVKQVLISVTFSVVITAFVLYACPSSWQALLTATKASAALGILGGFLSFALVLRTQSCYNRWWEARMQWGKMAVACIQIAGQAQTWLGSEDRATAFLTQCVLYPHACKAALRAVPGKGAAARPRRLTVLEKELRGGSSAPRPEIEAALGEIMRHGGPFACTGVMRRLVHEALAKGAGCKLSQELRGGALLAMEQAFFELNLTFGACLRIKETRMPATYTLFLSFFVRCFFVLASLMWAPTLRWLTPIIIGGMVFLLNTVVVIGDQMMQPFDLSWSGLPLEKFCTFVENEILNVSRQYFQLNVFDFLGEEGGAGDNT